MTIVLSESRGYPVIEDRWDLLHHHALGRAGKALLDGLDRGELISARCPACERLLLPPRSFCERCFEPTEFVPFDERRGTLLSFTIHRHPFHDSPAVPFAVGYARLNGASTAIGALMSGIDLKADRGDPELSVGMPVELTLDGVGLAIDRLRLRPASNA